MINGKKDYEMLDGSDFDALVEQNGTSIKDLGWDQYTTVDGDNKSYPMWKACLGPNTQESFQQLNEHFEGVRVEGEAMLEANKVKAASDNKSVNFDQDFAAEPVIFGDFFEKLKKVEFTEKDSKVGVVEPKAEMEKQEVPDMGKSNADSPKEDNSGAVKVPKAEFGGKAKAEEGDVSVENELVEEKAKGKATGEKVGVVKPKAEMGEQKVPNLYSTKKVEEPKSAQKVEVPEADFGEKYVKQVTEADFSKVAEVKTEYSYKFLESVNSLENIKSLTESVEE